MRLHDLFVVVAVNLIGVSIVISEVTRNVLNHVYEVLVWPVSEAGIVPRPRGVDKNFGLRAERV